MLVNEKERIKQGQEQAELARSGGHEEGGQRVEWGRWRRGGLGGEGGGDGEMRISYKSRDEDLFTNVNFFDCFQ